MLDCPVDVGQVLFENHKAAHASMPADVDIDEKGLCAGAIRGVGYWVPKPGRASLLRLRHLMSKPRREPSASLNVSSSCRVCF